MIYNAVVGRHGDCHANLPNLITHRLGGKTWI